MRREYGNIKAKKRETEIYKRLYADTISSENITLNIKIYTLITAVF